MESSKLMQNARATISAWRKSRQELQLINGINQELLDLFENISVAFPQLSRREQLSKLVQLRNRCDETESYKILHCAEESYANWPQERELTLCDVIHFLTVSEFYAKHEEDFWMGGNIAARVRAIVPHQLCRLKLREPYLSERRRLVRD